MTSELGNLSPAQRGLVDRGFPGASLERPLLGLLETTVLELEAAFLDGHD